METVGKTFAGARTPVGATVEFHARGRRIEAKVAELHRKNAILAAGEAGRWRVPYNAIRIVKPSPGQRRELNEADRLIQDLMVRQKVYHGLADEWSATFDLAAGRAGICYFRKKLICLAVSYCMTAPEEELIDTVLHEVAHALVGAEHNHDRKLANCCCHMEARGHAHRMHRRPLHGRDAHRQQVDRALQVRAAHPAQTPDPRDQENGRC